MSTRRQKKWCHWCQKDNHDSQECWSTHAVPDYDWVPAVLPFDRNPEFLGSVIDAVLDKYRPNPSGGK
jgi:hypothetical protein